MSEIKLSKIGVKYLPPKIGLEYFKNNGINKIIILDNEINLYEVDLDNYLENSAENIYNMLINQHNEYYNEEKVSKEQVFFIFILIFRLLIY